MSRARDIANYGDGIDTSSITSGTFADARIATSNVTQHEGSIDALASNPTITLGSNATISKSGMIVNSKIVENPTRTTVADTTFTDGEMINFGNYNKLFSGTDLFIHICLFTFAKTSQWTGNVGIKYGVGSTYWAQSYTFNDINKGQQLTIYAKLSGHTITGTQAISLRHGVPTSTGAPADIINPSSSDDTRINNSGKSVAIIHEVNA